jgi:glycosyltransferase involved in cell wall biosynthesis
MRKLLIISLHFPPSAASGSFRILGFCRHLPKFGWQPLVVACPQVPGEPLDPDLASLIPDQTQVEYVNYPTSALSRLSSKLLYRARAFKVDRHLPWSLAALQTCRQMIQQNQPDAILTSGPPHTTHLLGLKLKREFNLPLIADFRDPWVTSSNSKGLARIGQKLERTVFGAADRIIANAPKAQAAFQLAHPRQSHKITAITNGFDPDPFIQAPSLASDKIEILHAGELYHGRNPKPLFDALRLAETSRPQARWQLTFLGRASNLMNESSNPNCASRIIAEPQAPYLAAKTRMRNAHILLLLDTPGRQIGVPAKLYEYIGAGRPLLVLAEPNSDTANITRQSGLPHRIASPTDSAAIAQALIGLTEIAASQPSNPLRASSPFTRRTLTQQLATLLDQTQAPSVRNQPERQAA